IQPILMNTCAGCHASGRGGDFKLTRCYDATVNRRGLHQNLAAVLAQVDLERPATSPLLYKAVSAHGGAAQAPLPGRQAQPFRTLQEWAEQVIANNPHLRKDLLAGRAAAPASRPPASAAPAPAQATPAPQPAQTPVTGNGFATGKEAAGSRVPPAVPAPGQPAPVVSTGLTSAA